MRIEDYKVIIINSNGDMIFEGSMLDDKLHSEVLKQYIEKTYKEIKVPQQALLTDITEMLTKCGNILVFNLSGLAGHGFGIISSPSKITFNQNRKINELLNNLSEFELEFEFDGDEGYEVYGGSTEDDFEEIRLLFEKITIKKKKIKA